MSKYTVVALDLEGTLISNAMSQIPRHGLYEFLELCSQHLPEVVLYTAVRHQLSLKIANTLVEEDLAPAWFKKIECVDWSGPYKDLSFIKGHQPERALLVDDNKDYIATGQQAQWVQIEEFAHPYSDDHELQRVWNVLNDLLRLNTPW